MIVQADATRLPFADRSFDLVMGSPPYVDARLYLEDGKDLGISRECREWVEWMLVVTSEALRVSRGLVLWVASAKTEDRNYWPACEGLMWEWWNRGGHAYRPCFWHRYGIPGTGGDQWYRHTIEYVMAFKRPGKLPYADCRANGHVPKFVAGGAMSHRRKDGRREATGKRWGLGVTRRLQDGERKFQPTPAHDRYQEEGYPIAIPQNILSTGADTHYGSLAHDNEAPYPEAVPSWFLVSHCPPAGSCLDPFSGSGTTVAAALALGRKGFGSDLRLSQCRLSRKRIRTVTPGFVFKD